MESTGGPENSCFSISRPTSDLLRKQPSVLSGLASTLQEHVANTIFFSARQASYTAGYTGIQRGLSGDTCVFEAVEVAGDQMKLA